MAGTCTSMTAGTVAVGGATEWRSRRVAEWQSDRGSL